MSRGTLMLLLALASPAEAGWLRSFCERHIIADDPQPYAEVESAVLLEMWSGKGNPKVLDEILYRYRSGMMNQAEVAKFREIGSRE